MVIKLRQKYNCRLYPSCHFYILFIVLLSKEQSWFKKLHPFPRGIKYKLSCIIWGLNVSGLKYLSLTHLSSNMLFWRTEYTSLDYHTSQLSYMKYMQTEASFENFKQVFLLFNSLERSLHCSAGAFIWEHWLCLWKVFNWLYLQC